VKPYFYTLFDRTLGAMATRLHRCLEPHLPTGMTTPLRVILATTAALWMGPANAQTAPTSPVRPDVEWLRFRDFFRTPMGPKGIEMTDTLLQANGKTVRLTGYMVQQEIPTPGRFLLTPRPVQMSEHADGEADDLPAATTAVYLDAAQQDWTIPHVRGLIEVSGQLQVGRHEAPDGRIAWVRLQLAPDATRSMNALEVSGHLHALQHAH